MEKERKITAPEGCEIEKVELVDGEAVVTFREKERKLPKSWEEFCEMFPVTGIEHYIDNQSDINNATVLGKSRNKIIDKNLLPDRATAEAVLTLCQLIQLRNCYNGDWVPDFHSSDKKYTLEFETNRIIKNTTGTWPIILTFKTEEMRDEFLHNFRPLIEKLKPLYGIKEGGEE